MRIEQVPFKFAELRKNAPPRGRFGVHGDGEYHNGNTTTSSRRYHNKQHAQTAHDIKRELGFLEDFLGGAPTGGGAPAFINKLWDCLRTAHVHQTDPSKRDYHPTPSGAVYSGYCRLVARIGRAEASCKDTTGGLWGGPKAHRHSMAIAPYRPVPGSGRKCWLHRAAWARGAAYQTTHRGLSKGPRWGCAGAKQPPPGCRSPLGIWSRPPPARFVCF